VQWQHILKLWSPYTRLVSATHNTQHFSDKYTKNQHTISVFYRPPKPALSAARKETRTHMRPLGWHKTNLLTTRKYYSLYSRQKSWHTHWSNLTHWFFAVSHTCPPDTTANRHLSPPPTNANSGGSRTMYPASGTTYQLHTRTSHALSAYVTPVTTFQHIPIQSSLIYTRTL